MPASKKKDTFETLDVDIDIDTSKIEIRLIGTSPLLMNRMSEKVRQGLLFPAPEKNKAEKAQTLKHNPMDEFRNSVYKFRDDRPTRLLMPAGAFKDAIAKTALRVPGATKTEIGQLVQVNGLNVAIYGVPQLHMAVVRQAGINKTPDIRTRAVLPEWCCELTIEYTVPLVLIRTVFKLVGAAGHIMGVGDGRPEKGKLTHGKFRIVNDNPEEMAAWDRIAKAGGRKAQDAALAHPHCYDEEAEALLAWYDAETIRRRSRPAEEEAKPKTRRKKVPLIDAAEALANGVDGLGA